MKKYILIFILLLTTSSQAALTELGILPFKLESGARPLGMGSGFIAAAEDVNAAFWNPGGLPWAKVISLNLTNFENISAGQAYPTGFGQTVGISFYRSGVRGLPGVGGSGESYVSDNIFVLSVGTKASILPWFAGDKLAQNTGIGLNLKILTGQTLGQTGVPDRTAHGVEADLGVLCKYKRWLSFGGTVSNFIPLSDTLGALIWNDGKVDSAPAALKLGVAAKLIGDVWSPYYLENQVLLATADLELSRVFDPAVLLGTEYNYGGIYYLRGGLSARPQRGAMSMGGGLHYVSWGLDMAVYSDYLKGDILYQFSVLYFPEEWSFERRIEKKYAAIEIQEPISDIEPAEDAVTYDDRVLIKGRVKPEVTVKVNGREVFLDASRYFGVQIPLQQGKNLVQIEGYHKDGKITIDRKIFRKAKVLIAEESSVKKEVASARTSQEKQKAAEKQKVLEVRRAKVENLVTMGVVDTTPDKQFSLEAPITRGEMITWLVKAANMPIPKITRDLFTDVLRDDPQAPFIKAAVDRGFVKAFSDGTFRPDEPVTELEGKNIFRKFGVIK